MSSRAVKNSQKTLKLREDESAAASAWASQNAKDPLIVTGDFNMLANSVIMKKNWKNFTNAFSEVGFGFGDTKFTNFHGVRIDHILLSEAWRALEVQVITGLESDHAPVLASVELKALTKSN